MRKWILPLLLLCVFIFENVFSTVVPTNLFKAGNVTVPHFTFIVLMFIAIYYNATKSMYLAIVFGLLFDVVYTEVVGIYLFIFPIMAYVVSKAIKVLQVNIFIISVVVLLAIMVMEYYVYGIYTLIGFNNFSGMAFLMERIMPTLLLNAIFLLVCYYPLKKYLIWLLAMMEEK